MPKKENQKLKMLYLLKIISEETDCEHCLTMSELISKLTNYGIEAERKSIYADIECLNTYGADIEYEKNRGYYLGQRQFELPELKLLVDAVQSSKFITKKKSLELIKKIEGLTNHYDAKKLQRQVYVSNRIKNMNESIYYSVDNIQTAIADNTKISFRYFDWNEKKERVFHRDGATYIASPWALIWDNENYYLVAFDENDNKIKHYRVDKMINIESLKEKRTGEDAFHGIDVGSYSSTMFNMYGGETMTVSLSCKNNMAGIIIDRFGTDVTFFKDTDDRFIVNVKVSVSPMFITWLMNFGADIKIISPDSVIEKYKELSRVAANQYK